MSQPKPSQTPVKSEDENGNTNKVPGPRNVDYDEVLSAAGKFGCYQWRLFFATFPFYVFGAFSYFSQLFITEVPLDFWCWVPELKHMTPEDRRHLAIPTDESSRHGYSQCTVYVANWNEVLSSGKKPDASWPTEYCRHGWEYNRTEMPPMTFGMQYDWVCDDFSHQAIAQSIFFVGSIVGGLLIGWVADKYGRLPAAILSNLIGCVAGVVTVFSIGIISFSICRFFMGMSYNNCMIMIYLLVLEYVVPERRTIMSNVPFGIFFTVGLVLLPWLALLCKDWKWFSLATSLPMLLALAAPLVLMESPRWLLSKDRIDASIKNLEVIAKSNNKEIPPQLIEDFRNTVANKGHIVKSQGIREILKIPILGRNFTFTCVLLASSMSTFDVLVRFSGEIDFDFFLAFTILSLTELPSVLLVGFILDYTGRKWLSILASFVCGVFCVLTAIVKEGLPTVLCAMVARFMINMACNAVMLWAAEMLPTTVRGTGVAAVHISGYLGTIVSPFIIYTATYKTWMPLAISTGICITSVILALFLPETACKEMPQTIENAEHLARKAKFLEIPMFQKKSIRQASTSSHPSIRIT